MGRGPAEMPFLDHLEELRWRIIWSLVALIVGSLIGFFLVTQLNVIGILERPIRSLLPEQQLFYTSPTTPILITLKLAFVIGVLLSLPLAAYHAWRFLSPALYDRERHYVMPAVAMGSLLFMAGVAMAYFLVLPLGLRFLLGFQSESLSPIITIDEYLRFATGIILAFGAIFEMPVVLVVLALIGVITSDTLRRFRRHALVVLAILSAILTPADVATMLMMLTPMMLLYELSIWLIRWLVPARERSGDLAASQGVSG